MGAVDIWSDLNMQLWRDEHMLQSNVCRLTDTKKDNVQIWKQSPERSCDDIWKMYIHFPCRQPIYILIHRNYCDHGKADSTDILWWYETNSSFIWIAFLSMVNIPPNDSDSGAPGHQFTERQNLFLCVTLPHACLFPVRMCVINYCLVCPQPESNHRRSMCRFVKKLTYFG